MTDRTSDAAPPVRRWYVGEFREAATRQRTDTNDWQLMLQFGMAGDLARFPTRVYGCLPRGASQADIAKELRRLADAVERGFGETLC